ncbi:hypothetical protein CDD81_7752 [Ophiocordyceps australis]|uniref:Fe2OG dioxygenase domain-containing protein n=1 Tax=Ophiocordyceps australis TaxID=1399860 RepID=A0A2C5XGL9_9HYPO|nr:hypothetical protein CDD81_7752 [Ophiocordyceps australis]
MSSANLPLIDLAGPEQDVARRLVDAAEQHGFLYIRNLGHDIPAGSIDEAFSISKKLFQTTLDEKQRYAIGKDNHGWTGVRVETLDPEHQKIGDFKEAWNFAEFVNGKAQHPLPSVIAADEQRLSDFCNLCRKLCSKILYLLGLGLQIGDFFSSAHFTTQDDSGTILRLLHYPRMSDTNSNDEIRAGAHSDYGSMTLLFRLRGQAGLEILKKDNTWAPVPVIPPGTQDDPSPPILINFGDLLSYWTKGLFRSTLHRVTFPSSGSNGVQGESISQDRYSIAFFCHPIHSTRLEPVPSRRVQECTALDEESDINPYTKRRVMTAEEHVAMRLRATYTAINFGEDEPIKS